MPFDDIPNLQTLCYFLPIPKLQILFKSARPILDKIRSRVNIWPISYSLAELGEVMYGDSGRVGQDLGYALWYGNLDKALEGAIR